MRNSPRMRKMPRGASFDASGAVPSDRNRYIRLVNRRLKPGIEHAQALAGAVNLDRHEPGEAFEAARTIRRLLEIAGRAGHGAAHRDGARPRWSPLNGVDHAGMDGDGRNAERIGEMLGAAVVA